MCFGSSRLVLWLLSLLKTLACKMIKFVTCLELVFFSWTCKAFMVGSVTTLQTSIEVIWRWWSVWSCQFVVHFVPLWYLTLVLVMSMWFVVTWLGFCIRSLLFISMLWQFSPLMSQYVDLGSLGFPWYLFCMPHSGFWALKFFGQLPYSTCRKLV